MGILKNQTDLRSLQRAGQITADVLSTVQSLLAEGVSTLALERQANLLLSQNRSTAPFKSYDNFGHATCISINEEIVNGPPSRERILKTGDVISIATAAEHRGIHAKAARTWVVGHVESPDVSRLLSGTAKVIARAIAQSTQVDSLNALLVVMPECAEQYGLTILNGLGGAGIGKKLHEWPQVPNNPSLLDEVVPLVPGLAFVLMPMFSLGTDAEFDSHEDGWTYVTRDKSVSAHFADTLLMTEDGLINITSA